MAVLLVQLNVYFKHNFQCSAHTHRTHKGHSFKDICIKVTEYSTRALARSNLDKGRCILILLRAQIFKRQYHLGQGHREGSILCLAN